MEHLQEELHTEMTSHPEVETRKRNTCCANANTLFEYTALFCARVFTSGSSVVRDPKLPGTHEAPRDLQGNPNYSSAIRKRHDDACATDFQHSRPASHENGHRPAKVEPYPLIMHSKTFRGSSSEVQVTTHTFPEQVPLKTTHVHIYHPVHASLCIDGIGRSTSAPL